MNYSEAIEEFLSSAKDEELKKRYRASVTLYFKAIAEICDCIIYNKIRKIPSNHTERFEFLKNLFPDIYKILDETFSIYQATYRRNITKEELERIKNALERIKSYNK